MTPRERIERKAAARKAAAMAAANLPELKERLTRKCAPRLRDASGFPTGRDSSVEPNLAGIS